MFLVCLYMISLCFFDVLNYGFLGVILYYKYCFDFVENCLYLYSFVYGNNDI